ncbi:ECF transporter S component [Alkaliphilus peptidifermentans]|uniref:ABC-type cobalt transport system, permease component n=1 Tax=Alkaliphilus peptidifermentans DSM 18978 TaxID=1120976 RepID=A0A1G5GLV3_9FIRM|nr:ECF transporter S component [Alkaliphilus peptidifermentans]SCY52190.1 ABC-type cobalt transport system, permease component [Alkaliphilus peptidifermentans DSM 18978]
MPKERFLSRFSVFDLVVIAMMASLGIAIKPVVVPLAHIITGPLYIPGGVIAGGFYMLWLVLGAGLVGKRGTATLIALVQAIMVVAIGVFGTHGILSLITYLLPGVAVDLVLLITRHRGCCLGCCFLAGIAANISGTFLVNIVFFQLPLVPLILSLSSAALSGGIGGIIAFNIIKQFKKFNVINREL